MLTQNVSAYIIFGKFGVTVDLKQSPRGILEVPLASGKWECGLKVNVGFVCIF